MYLEKEKIVIENGLEVDEAKLKKDIGDFKFIREEVKLHDKSALYLPRHSSFTIIYTFVY